MKKFLFGMFITVIGLIFSAFCFIYTAINPCDYDGVTGLRGGIPWNRVTISVHYFSRDFNCGFINLLV
ncbi:MAG: hypothetical protein ACERKZ_04790 [Lachnotalea sp.]